MISSSEKKSLPSSEVLPSCLPAGRYERENTDNSPFAKGGARRAGDFWKGRKNPSLLRSTPFLPAGRQVRKGERGRKNGSFFLLVGRQVGVAEVLKPLGFKTKNRFCDF